MAMRIRDIFTAKGYKMFIDSPTNQQFVILENEKMKSLSEKVKFSFWEKIDENHTAVRFATCWATTKEDTDKVIEIIKANPDVVVIVDEKSYEGTYDVINAVGTVLGAEDEAQAVVKDMQDTYAAIATEPSEDAPSVYYCLGYGEYGEYAATIHSQTTLSFQLVQ